MRWTAAWASAACSVLFLGVYSATNALAGLHAELPTWHYPWEESIPFVPLMIVPYMSEDLFFVAAPFLCRSVTEIKLLVQRYTMAILVAAVFFLAWPLRPAFERQPVDGALGAIFETLWAFDAPHNLFPSLHIALVFILRWTYHRRLRGVWRLLMHVQFTLITISTVLTHQHHVVDLVGGFVLGVLTYYVFPTHAVPRTVHAPSPRLAACFGVGAAAAAAVMLVADPRTLVFWLGAWVATALALVAAGYAGLGPRVFQKGSGARSLPARFVLAPYLLGLWLTRQWYWRRAPQWRREVAEDVWVGRLPDQAMAQALDGATIIDLTAEHDAPTSLRGTRYHNVPLMDLARPDPAALDHVADLIDHGRAHGPVYVHCALGRGRSVAAIERWACR